MALLHLGNNFVETTKPWTLKNSKKVEEIEKLDTILRVTMEVLRCSGIALQPIIPILSSCLLDKLNVDKRLWTHMKWNEADMVVEKVLGTGDTVLFRRIQPTLINSNSVEVASKKKRIL
jgi:methionyl-tRNA synthetase